SQRQCAVYVVDAEPPSLICTDQVVECTGGPVNFQEPFSLDNCPNLTISFTPTNGSTLGVGVHQINAVAGDVNGKSHQSPLTGTLQHTRPPSFPAPATLTVQCGQPPDPSATATATAQDTCDNIPTVTSSDATSGTCPVIITRTWTAVDHTGNSNQCVQ